MAQIKYKDSYLSTTSIIDNIDNTLADLDNKLNTEAKDLSKDIEEASTAIKLLSARMQRLESMVQLIVGVGSISIIVLILHILFW